jgi:hypothetical protein
MAALSNTNISSIGDAQIQLEVTVSGTALPTTSPAASSGNSDSGYNPPVALPPVVQKPVVVQKKTVRYLGFAPNLGALSASAKAGITKSIWGYSSVKSVVCTGFAVGTKDNRFSIRVAQMRAKNACDLVKRLSPKASTQLKVDVSMVGGANQRGVSIKVTGEQNGS